VKKIISLAETGRPKRGKRRQNSPLLAADVPLASEAARLVLAGFTLIAKAFRSLKRTRSCFI